MAKLVLRFGPTVLKEYALGSNPVTIGRSPQSSLAIDNPAMSFHHARIIFDDGHYHLEDLNSTNGTFVNGKRITKVPLRGGDQIEVGNHTIQFLVPPPGGEAGAAPDAPAAPVGPEVESIESTMMLDTRRRRELQEKAAGKAPGAAAPEAKKLVGKLTVLNGKTSAKEYLLTAQTSMIGKAATSAIKLTGWFAPQMAGIILKRGDVYTISPAGKKPLLVNNRPVPTRHDLKEGDVISAGGVEFRFEHAPW